MLLDNTKPNHFMVKKVFAQPFHVQKEEHHL